MDRDTYLANLQAREVRINSELSGLYASRAALDKELEDVGAEIEPRVMALGRIGPEIKRIEDGGEITAPIPDGREPVPVVPGQHFMFEQEGAPSGSDT